jgi:hypothetical protein
VGVSGTGEGDSVTGAAVDAAMPQCMEGSTNELAAAFRGCRSEAGGDRAPVHYSSSSMPVVWRWTSQTLATAAESSHHERM